jgi:hypothetical protein
MLSDHGGFDIFGEVSAALLRDIVSDRLPTTLPSQPFATTTPSASGTVAFALDLVEVILGPSPNVRLEVDADLAVDLTDSPIGAIPTITATARLSVQAGLNVAGLAVRLAITDTTVPGAATLDFVGLDLLIDTARQQAMMAGEDPDVAADRALTEFRQAIDVSIQNAVARIPTEGFVVLTFPAALGAPLPATASLAIDASARTNTLRLGATFTGGTPGSFEIARGPSRLQAAEGALLIVPFATLLGRIARPLLDGRLGLSAGMGTFAPNHPFAWTGTATLTTTDVGNVNWTSVRGSTPSSTPGITVAASMAARFLEGAVNARASGNIAATVGVVRAGARLTLSLTLSPIVITQSQVDVEAWVYVAMVFGGGVFLTVALATADAVADGEMARRIEETALPALAPVTVALPPELPTTGPVGRVAMLEPEPRVFDMGLEATRDLIVTLRR